MPHDPNQDLTELHRWIAEVSPEGLAVGRGMPVAEALALAGRHAREFK